MPRAEAEEAALGACTVGHEGVRSGGGVLLITRGIIYDVIVEPASVGSMTDEHGHQRPVAFFAYRVNGRYIMEGLASSFLFTMGGLGFINLDRSSVSNIPKLSRLLLFTRFDCVLLSFFKAKVFMRMKLPGCLMG
ncbi:Oligosaccharyltransferase complex subunit OSTC [Manis javanica]|nr:Oligosaccharyltransferase complex subunit OSTC [Manis javanica]